MITFRRVFPTWEYPAAWEVKTMIEKTNTAELVDIRTVHVDKDLPKQERIAEYIRQIKDPYHFKCGKFTVKVRFADSGPTLEDCLQRLMA